MNISPREAPRLHVEPAHDAEIDRLHRAVDAD